MGADYATLRYDVADAIATVTLDRPDARNALDATMKRELLDAFRAIARDRFVRVAILRGAGPAFCSGQDLREASGADAPDLAEIVRDAYNPLILAMRRLEKPIVAAVNGVAAGAGASLALGCDIRVASETASFLFSFGRVGLVPDTGATWLLPRLIGPGRAAQLMLLGEPLAAEEALRWGLVAQVVPASDLAAEARAIAARLAGMAPRALALTKRALNRALESTFEEALDYEASLQGIAGRTADYREGVAAFVSKRSPRFTGE